MRNKLILCFILLLIMNVTVVNANTIEENIENLNQRLDAVENNAFLLSHPIGSVYETTSSDENTVAKMHNKHGGTWEVYGSGRMLIGVNSSDTDFNMVNKTGGSKTATLTTANLANHNHSIPVLSGTTSSSDDHTHSISGTAQSAGSHTHSFTSTGAYLNIPADSGTEHGLKSGRYGEGPFQLWGLGTATESAGAHTHSISGTAQSAGSHSHTVSTNTSTTGSTGDGAAFSILNPYITVYRYKRTG